MAVAFSASATAHSHHPIPFASTRGLLSNYYAFITANAFGVIYALTMVIVGCCIKGEHEGKFSILVYLGDFAMIIALGMTTWYLAGTYACPPGEYNGWCDFYNVSIFFGTLGFVLFAITMCWSFFVEWCPGCCCRYNVD